MNCKQCGHSQNVHYVENGMRKCLGIQFACDCIKQYYESDRE